MLNVLLEEAKAGTARLSTNPLGSLHQGSLSWRRALDLLQRLDAKLAKQGTTPRDRTPPDLFNLARRICEVGIISKHEGISKARALI